jgi:anaerobic selenocysteine-containing dehydrogenase
MNKHETEEIKGYCALCAGWCPTVSYVRDGVFTEVRPDEENPRACGLCIKGLAGPELVYNRQRLQYPMKRTKPKGGDDPGWARISWDEALDTVATKLNEVKAKYGPEAVVFAQAAAGGSPMLEVVPWVIRLANAFGTPNSISTTHICQWHRDNCSAYTYGNIGGRGSVGEPEFERAACILIWGSNIHATRNPLVPLIGRGLERGAKLIVVDPRQIKVAGMADLWLQVRPGTDGALALSMLNVVIEEKLYDYAFVRDWTTAPFLVRGDTGNFLRGSDLADGMATSSYVMVDSVNEKPRAYIPGTELPIEPILDSTYTIVTTTGEEVECQTVFRLLRESVSEYRPSRVEKLTGVPQEKIADAARMFATIKPSCWYSWNGIEQNTNASQTNRAVCILYALTGNYDVPGGNVVLSPLTARVDGRELISPEVQRKRLGSTERPLGPSGLKFDSVQAYEVYRAILTGKPYPIKAMLGFGGNLVSSNAPTLTAKKALSQLDFLAQAELFMSPTAELADIVIPAASCWEDWHIGATLSPLGEEAYIQLRPAAVSPRHESRSDMEIIFELAKRLGLGNKFWDGDIQAAFNYQLAPLNVSVEQLVMNPGGIAIDLFPEYKKYAKKDSMGNFVGFPTTSKRVEIYSSVFKEHGYDPLPTWKEPACLRRQKQEAEYPLILTGSKVMEYCHSQHRALPSLRKVVPNPFLEIHPQKALELGFKDGDWLIVETALGSATLQAKLTKGIPHDVVCAQHGWWQACPELGLPGYDPYSARGANVNLLYGDGEVDPISGSLPIKGQLCKVRRAPR